MGTCENFDPINGGFKVYEYKVIGVVGKNRNSPGVKILDIPTRENSVAPPQRSGRSVAYLSIDRKTGNIECLKFYRNHEGWREIHFHKEGEENPTGTVHWHQYIKKGPNEYKRTPAAAIPRWLRKQNKPLLKKIQRWNRKHGDPNFKLKYDFKVREKKKRGKKNRGKKKEGNNE